MHAHLILLLAAAFWGFGNISQKMVLTHIGPLSAVCLRCAIAAAVTLPFLLLERRKPMAAGYWISILGVSSAFAAALIIQQVAYIEATVTNASFLVNTATVFTPLLAWIALGEYPGRLGGVAAGLTLVGIFLMSNGTTGLTALNAGDMACLLSAFFYAIWMVALGRHAQAFGLPVTSTLVQFVVAACLALPALLWFEAATPDLIAPAMFDLAILGIFTTAAAFGLQTFAQRFTSASKAAVLVSAESIFGAAGAYVVLGERPHVTAIIGAAFIFSAILIVATAPGRSMPSPSQESS
jgi:drug/metabolite transporter (DMT)-like permease